MGSQQSVMQVAREQQPRRPATPPDPSSPAPGGRRECGEGCTSPEQPQASSKAPADLAEALRRAPKELPPRYLYDEAGSQLYEKVERCCCAGG